MKIVVVGASDLFDLVSISLHQKEHKIIGYSSLVKIDNSCYSKHAFLGENLTKIANKDKDIKFVIGVEDNFKRQKLINEVKSIGSEILTLVHPSVVVYDSAEISEGVIIQAGAVISSNSSIGIGSYIGYKSLIGHDVIIGEYNFIAPSSELLGESKIGNLNYLGTKSVLFPKVNIYNNCKLSSGVHLRRNLHSNTTVINEQKNRILNI